MNGQQGMLATTTKEADMFCKLFGVPWKLRTILCMVGEKKPNTIRKKGKSKLSSWTWMPCLLKGISNKAQASVVCNHEGEMTAVSIEGDTRMVVQLWEERQGRKIGDLCHPPGGQVA